MAVYEVFTHQISYRYKSTVCSQATVVLVVSVVLATILPLIISYRSNGFWLKTDSYVEQPDVKFIRDYLLVLETSNPSTPIFCSSHFVWQGGLQRHCLFKSREQDRNRDGRGDHIEIQVKLPLHANETVFSVSLLLPLDFRISNLCQLRMQSMAALQYSAGQPGASFHSTADLSFVQRKPVDYRVIESLFDEPLFRKGMSLHDLFMSYSGRNFSTTLINRYDIWMTGRSSTDPFILTLKLVIPESTIIYRPGFWQIIKWAWIQYFSILMVFLYVFRLLLEYIFSNQLVSTWKFVPWKKIV